MIKKVMIKMRIFLVLFILAPSILFVGCDITGTEDTNGGTGVWSGGGGDGGDTPVSQEPGDASVSGDPKVNITNFNGAVKNMTDSLKTGMEGVYTAVGAVSNNFTETVIDKEFTQLEAENFTDAR